MRFDRNDGFLMNAELYFEKRAFYTNRHLPKELGGRTGMAFDSNVGPVTKKPRVHGGIVRWICFSTSNSTYLLQLDPNFFLEGD